MWEKRCVAAVIVGANASSPLLPSPPSPPLPFLEAAKMQQKLLRHFPDPLPAANYFLVNSLAATADAADAVACSSLHSTLCVAFQSAFWHSRVQ